MEIKKREDIPENRQVRLTLAVDADHVAAVAGAVLSGHQVHRPGGRRGLPGQH